ncbi:glutamate racemase [Candidatus Woesebacteria bacterium]|nr:glutamate racemase [Candidatus Woesebacteria bacterium]
MRIGVIDSGVGGLSILRALKIEFPYLEYVYIADYAYAPYSEKTHAVLQERARQLVTTLTQEYSCNLIVIACNTLTVTSIGTTRTYFPGLPIIGTVPPIKVAADTLPPGSIALVIATKNTVTSSYLQELIQTYGKDIQYILEGSTALVKAIEVQNQIVIEEELRRMITPHADSISAVLIGCTHFSFVTEYIKTLLQPQTVVLEPQTGITARLAELVSTAHLESNHQGDITLLSTDAQKQEHLELFWANSQNIRPPK